MKTLNQRLMSLAVRISRKQSASPWKPDCEEVNLFDELRQPMHDLRRLREQLRIATDCGWTHAAMAIRSQMRYALRQMWTDLAPVDQAPKSDPAPIQLQSLYEELRQLDQEFDTFEYRGKERQLVVTTNPITLEEVDLGRFEIRLLLDELHQTEPPKALRIVALTPNRATGDSRVTHPHVCDEHLCPGEGAVPLQAALAEYRLCDLFMLVRSVLETYNADSAYVPLDNWDGGACSECGYSDESPSSCSKCEYDFCDDCMSYCRSCDASLCGGCLTGCPGCDTRLCEECLTSCSKCDTDYCSGCLTDGLCFECQPEEKHDDANDATNPDGAAAEPAETPAIVLEAA